MSSRMKGWALAAVMPTLFTTASFAVAQDVSVLKDLTAVRPPTLSLQPVPATRICRDPGGRSWRCS